MTYKQRFQKVLCIALAIASVSSTITPTSYGVAVAELQEDGRFFALARHIGSGL
ncbi:hypothetical protein FACS1894198_3270 [Clostridia bacterium]|nr:hypothetical protein FACS1894198_3270 [Clostridia bacterium]